MPRAKQLNLQTVPLTMTKCFVSYAHQDKAWCDELIKALKSNKKYSDFQLYFDRELNLGEDWDKKIHEDIDNLQLMIILLSSSMLSSDYCYGAEFQHVLDRCAGGQTKLIPVVISNCDWQRSPLANFQTIIRNDPQIFDKDVSVSCQHIADHIIKMARNMTSKKTDNESENQ